MSADHTSQDETGQDETGQDETGQDPPETDYLVVGSGAMGLAFADSLLHERNDRRLVIVDRHHGPGGHWNDAYPFVRLHQPSAFYGVNSRPLGGDGRDDDPLNPGMSERASAAEILDYYQQVMAALVASGRVEYLPMSEYERTAGGEHVIRSLLTGETSPIRVNRKVVDTTHLNTAVPSTHPPRYAVADGVACVPVNALAEIRTAPARFVVVGAGKTGIDACLWLLARDVDPDRITWVMPRDSWFLNRANIQPGPEFFLDTFGSMALQMEAVAAADSLPDLFRRLESTGQLLRLDPSVEPRMYHAAVVSQAELERLRTIRNVVRQGRVTNIEPTRMVLEDGVVEADLGSLYVDCSASAVELRPAIAVFAGDVITPQFIRPFQPTFSAALIGYVESHYDDERTQNEICGVVPLPDTPVSWLTMHAASMVNQARWAQEPELGRWVVGSRLDGFTALSRSVDRADTERLAVLQRFRQAARAAGAALPGLLATAPSPR